MQLAQSRGRLIFNPRPAAVSCSQVQRLLLCELPSTIGQVMHRAAFSSATAMMTPTPDPCPTDGGSGRSCRSGRDGLSRRFTRNVGVIIKPRGSCPAIKTNRLLW
ncbi:unnamed protein product [Ectocarpus sp. 8 AP-2014]